MKPQGIIIGAGIGGLTAALALRQQGIRAEVYERAPEIREVGAGLVLAPNALAVLDQLGLIPLINAQSWPLRAALITRANGAIVRAIDVPVLEQQYGYGMRVIHRGTLQTLLKNALPADQLHTNREVLAMADEDQRVAVSFAGGFTASADFVVGADGIRSSVRRALLGEKPLRFAGQTCWRAIVDLPAEEPHTSVEYWGREPGLRFGLVPIGPAQQYLYVTAAAPAGGQDRPGQVLANLRKLSAGFAPPVGRVLDALDESRIHRADLFDLPTLERWSVGRITLLGDAAHATTPNLGQGACQAIEDAQALARCLAAAQSVENALQTYQQQRKAKADRVVRISRQIGQTVDAPAWIKPLLFSALKLVPDSLSQRQFAAIFRV